jgi:hypothetical protein
MPLSLRVTPSLTKAIPDQMTSRTRLTRKQVDDVLGGDEAWKHADSTTGMFPGIPDT